MKKFNIVLFLFIFVFCFILFGCNKIEDPPKTIFVISGETCVTVGDTITLSVPGFDSSKIAWTSSKSSVAQVQNGVVTGLASGETKIQARLGSYGASVIISVTGSSASETSIYTVQALEILSKMSLEEKVGQLFMVGINGKSLSSQEEDIIKEYNFGNFYISDQNISSSSKLISLTQKLQEVALLENGIGAFIASSLTFSKNELYNINQVNYPKQLVVGNGADQDKVKKAGGYISKELASYGINFDFIYSLNNMTGDAGRGEEPITLEAFSSDTQVTSKLANALISGINENNVVACGGVFPIYNSGERDISKSDKYFDVFKNAILSGMDAISINDVVYTIIDNTNPSTISSLVINDFLRTKLGFSGVCVSSDLNEFSVAYDSEKELYSRPAVLGLYAGLDMFYFSSISEDCKNYYADIIEAYNSELLSIDVIDKAVLRILELKVKYGITKYDASKVDGKYDQVNKELLIEELNKYIVTNISSFEFSQIEKEEKIMIVASNFNFTSGSKSIGEEMKRMMVEDGYNESNIEFKAINDVRGMRNLFNEWRQEDYIGDTSKYDRVILIFPYSSSYNDYNRVKQNLGERDNIYVICMNSLNGAWCFNEEYPTLLVYGDSEKEYQIMFKNLYLSIDRMTAR